MDEILLAAGRAPNIEGLNLEAANVVHMGDTFFRGRFPFIDTASGGSIDGLIAAVEEALSLSDGDPRIIPE